MASINTNEVASELIDYVKSNGGDIDRLVNDPQYMTDCMREKTKSTMQLYDQMEQEYRDSPVQFKAKIRL